MSIFSFQTRVPYGSVDEKLNLTLKGAMELMQESAILHSSQCRFSINDVSETHVVWMLVQWRVRMLGSVSWNDRLEVQTWPRTMERVTSMRNFEIYGPGGNLAAVGESNWVLVSADTGRMTRITPEVAAAYDLTNRDVFDSQLPDIPNGEGELRFSGTVQRRDIDTNHHVNNLVYLDYAREALPQELADREFLEVSVRYRRQMLVGDPVFCYYRQEGSCHVIDICGEERSHIHATVAFFEE